MYHSVVRSPSEGRDARSAIAASDSLRCAFILINILHFVSIIFGVCGTLFRYLTRIPSSLEKIVETFWKSWGDLNCNEMHRKVEQSLARFP